MQTIDFASPVFQSFLIVIVIGAVFAVILSLLARGESKTKGMEKIAAGDKLFSSVFQEIGKLPLSPRQKAQATESIAELLDKEVQKKMDVTAKELNHKYEKIVQEKDGAVKAVEHQYKLVQEKYKTVEENYKRLGKEKKQTEAIVHSMAEGLIVVNKQGQVLLMNPAAEKLLGAKKGEGVGKSILSDFKEEELISWAEEMEGKEEKEIILKSKSDETRVILRASNAIIESENGQTLGMVSVLSDVTKQKELDELKSSFVASVSHELRTPLYTVQESLSLLMDQVGGTLGMEQQKILSIASSNVRQLSRLINDLLDFSKLEAKKLQLNSSPCRLDEILRHTVSGFEPWAKTKKIDLQAVFRSEPIEVEADADRLTQVFTNLVGNAMKFTPSGGKITLEAKRDEQHDPKSSGFAVIRVSDTGPGIPKRDQKRIFEKFVQLDSSRRDGPSGTGLGLTISKEIVELHGGQIWVESEEGKGSCFVVQIPQKPKS